MQQAIIIAMLPAGIPHLASRLAYVDGDHLPHSHGACRGSLTLSCQAIHVEGQK